MDVGLSEVAIGNWLVVVVDDASGRATEGLGAEVDFWLQCQKVTLTTGWQGLVFGLDILDCSRMDKA